MLLRVCVVWPCLVWCSVLVLVNQWSIGVSAGWNVGMVGSVNGVIPDTVKARINGWKDREVESVVAWKSPPM